MDAWSPHSMVPLQSAFMLLKSQWNPMNSYIRGENPIKNHHWTVGIDEIFMGFHFRCYQIPSNIPWKIPWTIPSTPMKNPMNIHINPIKNPIKIPWKLQFLGEIPQKNHPEIRSPKSQEIDTDASGFISPDEILEHTSNPAVCRGRSREIRGLKLKRWMELMMLMINMEVMTRLWWLEWFDSQYMIWWLEWDG